MRFARTAAANTLAITGLNNLAMLGPRPNESADTQEMDEPMSASRTRPKRGFDSKRIILVGLMFAFSVMSYFDRTIMSIAGPRIMMEFGIAPTQMGSIYSAFILGYFLFMIPGGQMADWLGPRVTLGLMGLAAALFTGLTALGGKPGLGSYLGVIPAFIAIRFCMGVGTAPLYPACGRMGMHWIPSIHQARVQALIIAGSSMGGAVSPIVFS